MTILCDSSSNQESTPAAQWITEILSVALILAFTFVLYRVIVTNRAKYLMALTSLFIGFNISICVYATANQEFIRQNCKEDQD
jgi:multisubunit Na+/H+ antiporter MnhF subunit